VSRELIQRLELERMMGVDVVFRQPDRAQKLAAAQAEVARCTRCRLHETRTKTVFARGDSDAALMFIGEGPGADEDASGLPFVGRAGKLLDLMIQAMGCERDAVYIANIVKCRPPKNRDPQADEVEACWPFLDAQISLVQPQVIVTLGLPAARTLLHSKLSMGKLRGRWHDYNGVPVMPIYHPAYLLRSPGQKRKAWDDLKMVMARTE
jgi:uracil-DNA glycosylase